MVDQNIFLLMSQEQLKAFLKKVDSDKSIQKKILGVADVDTIISIAKEAGFALSVDEVTEGLLTLNDDQLKQVAAGLSGNRMEFNYDQLEG